jgi:hypothetical protein
LTAAGSRSRLSREEATMRSLSVLLCLFLTTVCFGQVASISSIPESVKTKGYLAAGDDGAVNFPEGSEQLGYFDYAGAQTGRYKTKQLVFLVLNISQIDNQDGTVSYWGTTKGAPVSDGSVKTYPIDWYSVQTPKVIPGYRRFQQRLFIGRFNGVTGATLSDPNTGEVTKKNIPVITAVYADF